MPAAFLRDWRGGTGRGRPAWPLGFPGHRGNSASGLDMTGTLTVNGLIINHWPQLPAQAAGRIAGITTLTYVSAA